MKPNQRQSLSMYENMVLSRKYEIALAEAYLEGKQPVFNMAKGPLPGELHLSDGQEPPAVALNIHLRPGDHLAVGHRPHGHALAKGVDINRLTAEIFGKRSGLSGGRGGHMHLFEKDVSFWTSGIIGQSVGPAVGAALAFKMRGEDNVAVAVLGEGGANAGPFHEGLNLAAVWKLPFILIVEDNGWAVSVPKSASTAVPTNDLRALGYGIPGKHLPGNDPDLIFEAYGEAIELARAGGGPSLIEVETFRLAGHFQGDVEPYRPKAEIKAKGEKDPIPHYRKRLIDKGWLTEAQDIEINTRTQRRIDDAIAYARSEPYPAPEEALHKVYV